MRARVVGDLPVALGLDEMMRQVVALQMVVKDNALVDGKGNKIADSPSTPAAVADNFSKSFLTNNVTFYNKQIIGVVGGAAQSPVDLRGAQQDEDLGQLSFNYTPIWAADPDPWSPGALSGTVVSPQPSLVKNTGLTWEIEVARHHQMILTHGPLHEKDYRLALVNAHWGGSEHSLEGKFFDGELHLIHHHLQYSDVKVREEMGGKSDLTTCLRRRAGTWRGSLWWRSSSPSTTRMPTLSWRRSERFSQGLRCTCKTS